MIIRVALLLLLVSGPCTRRRHDPAQRHHLHARRRPGLCGLGDGDRGRGGHRDRRRSHVSRSRPGDRPRRGVGHPRTRRRTCAHVQPRILPEPGGPARHEIRRPSASNGLANSRSNCPRARGCADAPGTRTTGMCRNSPRARCSTKPSATGRSTSNESTGTPAG